MLAALAVGCSNDTSQAKANPGAGAAPASAGSSSSNAGSGNGGAAGGGTAGSATTGGNLGGGAGGMPEPPFETDNLLINGDAEQGTTAWLIAAKSAALVAEAYGGDGYPAAGDPGPASRGTSFFQGGNNPAADSHQVVDLSPFADRVGQGIRFTLAAYLGGYAAQDDRASVVLSLLADDGTELSSATLGGPYAAERLGTTGLFANTIDAMVPPATHSIDVHLVVTRAGGAGADGYVDNVSLRLHN